ncbi:ABC transporter permease subunit [Nesterenkonia pannonica]|uniref:ABC transporter permease n=1 Tax=Nesterenkonia pannonica TaxID=1548602 RepID=UPI0021649003|nr:ABC transporter permease subunit [Nesterenkonia pannonica]
MQDAARRERTLHRVRTAALFVVALAAFLGIWQLLTLGYDDGGLAPPPRPAGSGSSRCSAARSRTTPNDVGIFFHLLASLQRVALGFGLAAVVAIPLGLLLGTHRSINAALDPFIQVLRPVSPLAWLPIGLALLRDAEGTAVFVIFMASLWIILINTIDGVSRVSPLYLDLARTLEATPANRTLKILVPPPFPAS